ncbi:MAG: sensor histidine kinase [Sarcina sp.]
MFLSKSNIYIILKSIMMVGVVGFNLAFNQKVNYFLLALYIWINIGFFIFNEFCKSEKYKKFCEVVQIILLILFSIKGIKLSLITIVMIFVTKIKFDIWGGLLSLGFLIITSMIIESNTEVLFYLYLSILYMFMYYCNTNLFDRIIKLEKLEDKGRNELIKLKDKSEKSLEKSKQNIKLARLEERNELGRKMHDRIGHIIAGSLLRLEAAKIVMGIDKVKGEVMIDEVTDNLRSGMEDIRDIVHKTTPLKEEIGINRIRNLLIEKLNHSGIDFEVSFSGDLSVIEYSLWNTIEEFVVEMSTNSIKYSRCSKMNFHIDIMNKIIKIQFKDDGVGGDKVVKGYGLSKIEEEVISIGGRFIIDGKNGFNAVILINK